MNATLLPNAVFTGAPLLHNWWKTQLCVARPKCKTDS